MTRAELVTAAFLDGGSWSACFGLSWSDLRMYDAMHHGRLSHRRGMIRHRTGTMGVASTRSRIVADFLDDSDAAWLWFIDSDMGFQADTIDRLIEAADPAERPIVGGLCFAQKTAGVGPLYAERFRIQPTIYTWHDLGDECGFRPVLDYERDSVILTAGTGAACLLMHRGALEKIRAHERWGGDNWFTPIVHPTGNKGRPREFSEDLSFCVRAQACDLPIHVATGVRTTHEKEGIYLDEETFDLQQASA